MKNLNTYLIHAIYLVVMGFLVMFGYRQYLEVQVQRVKALEAKVEEQIATEQAKQASTMAMRTNELAKAHAERAKTEVEKARKALEACQNR